MNRLKELKRSASPMIVEDIKLEELHRNISGKIEGLG